MSCLSVSPLLVRQFSCFLMLRALVLCVSVAGLLSLTMSICCVFDARKTHGKLRAPRSPSQALPHPPSPSFPTQANESQAYVCEHRHVYDDLATYLTARHLGEGAAQQADGKSCGTRPGMALEMKGCVSCSVTKSQDPSL